MRDVETCVVNDLASVKEDVDINNPGIPFHIAHASHLNFDGIDAIQQFMRVKGSADLNYLIEEIRLVCIAPWGRAVTR